MHLLQKMYRPSAGLANQPQLNPAIHQEAACREFFIDLNKKNTISLEPQLRFQIYLHQVVGKNVLNKTRSIKTIFDELFFQVCNCNITILCVAIIATLQLQLSCSVVSTSCDHLEPCFCTIATGFNQLQPSCKSSQ